MKKIRDLIRAKLSNQEGESVKSSIELLEIKLQTIERRLSGLDRDVIDLKYLLDKQHENNFMNEKMIPHSGWKIFLENLLSHDIFLMILASTAMGIVASSLVWLYFNML